jgi:hypothetical protein
VEGGVKNDPKSRYINNGWPLKYYCNIEVKEIHWVVQEQILFAFVTKRDVEKGQTFSGKKW